MLKLCNLGMTYNGPRTPNLIREGCPKMFHFQPRVSIHQLTVTVLHISNCYYLVHSSYCYIMDHMLSLRGNFKLILCFHLSLDNR